MKLLKYIIIRFFFMFLILITVMTAIFFIAQLGMMGLWSFSHPVTEDIPFVCDMYVQFIRGLLLDWDWGFNRRGVPVWEDTLFRIPFTIKINLYAFLVYVPLGIILGIVSAVKKNKLIDHIIGILALIFSSIPSFVLIFLLIYFLGYQLSWFPPMYPPDIFGFKSRLLGFVIPIIALSAGPIADITRHVRGDLSEAFESEYFLMLRIKGLNRRQAILRHALRNCMVPLLPVILYSVMFVLTGSFFIEIIYSIPGAAQGFFRSIFLRMYGVWAISIDLNSLVLYASFYTIIGLVFGFLIDVSYGIIDPRIKIGAKK